MDKRELMAMAGRLNHAYGRLELNCDGHRVTAEVQPVKPLRYEIFVFVDGVLKGEWFFTDRPVPDFAPKFYRETQRYVFSHKMRDHMRKCAASKDAEIRKFGKDRDKKYTVRHATWPSGRAFQAHLAKTCTSIELASDDAAAA